MQLSILLFGLSTRIRHRTSLLLHAKILIDDVDEKGKDTINRILMRTANANSGSSGRGLRI